MSSIAKSIVFLVSSNGGSLKFITEYLKLYPISDIKISHVVADRKCGAIDYSEKNSIPNTVLTYNKSNRDDLFDLLVNIRPDLIVTNIFKVLDSKIVNAFRNKLINFHYSLLPAFKGFIGMKTLKEAIKLNCQYVGSTCHYVDEEVDNGKIVSQCIFKLGENKNEKQLINTMFRANCILALNSLLSILKLGIPTTESLYILDKRVDFSPSISDLIKNPQKELWYTVEMA